MEHHLKSPLEVQQLASGGTVSYPEFLRHSTLTPKAQSKRAFRRPQVHVSRTPVGSFPVTGGTIRPKSLAALTTLLNKQEFIFPGSSHIITTHHKEVTDTEKQ